MKALASIERLAEFPQRIHLAIGVFDGVHLGHQEVIRSAVKAAADEGGEAVVLTFDPHPIEVLAPEKAPAMLMTTSQKRDIFKSIGASHSVILPFDREFAQLEGEVFVKLLANAGSELASIHVGEDWVFGRGRKGTIETMRSLGAKHGFAVGAVAHVEYGGQRISSTLIRQALAGGDLTIARSMLGRDYSVCGRVVKGKQLGRQLGFPTANLAPATPVIPPHGVYVVEGRKDGWRARGIANIGIRPTLDDGLTEKRLEAHFLDLDEDLYGETLEVVLLENVRPEQAFPNVDALVDQIRSDVAYARRWWLERETES